MTPFGDTVQEQVDSYEDKGLKALLKIQQTNPKLLAGIAYDNLVADVESGNSQKALQSGMGMGGQPSVLDRQATAVADGSLLNAASRVGPGIQQRGNQIAQQQRYPGQQPGVGGQPGLGGRQPAQNQRRPAQPGMRMNMQARNPAIGTPTPTGLPTMRSNLPATAAQGGIVGYEEGGDVDGGWWEIIKEADRKGTAQLHEEQQLRREQGRSIRDYIPFIEPKGQFWLKNALYDASRGIGSLLNKRRPEAASSWWGQPAPITPEPKHGSAVLSETDTFRRATEILNNPESTDEEKAFARMQLEGLEDAPMRAEMLQQVDKINAARGAGMAGGGPIKGYEEGGDISTFPGMQELLDQFGISADTPEQYKLQELEERLGPDAYKAAVDTAREAWLREDPNPAAYAHFNFEENQENLDPPRVDPSRVDPSRISPSKTRLPAALSAIEDLGTPLAWARQELESRAKEGSLEQELLQGNILTGPATGTVLGGEGGLPSDIRKILEDPSRYDSWQKILGGSTVATGEAGVQGLLKALGGGWAGIKYGFKSGIDALGGGSQRIDEITMETRQANMSRIDSEFDSNITRLQTALQELQANSDFLPTPEGQARLQELQEQIAATREKHRVAIQEIVDSPLPSEEMKEGYSGIRGQVLDWMKRYEEDPESTQIGNLLGQVRDYGQESGFGTVEERAADAQQIEVDREAISAGSEEAISSQRGTTTDDEYRLGMAIQNMFTPQGGAITPETPEQTGGIDSALTTDPNVWDAIMRVSNVLGKGAGASKGWEGINIAQGMQQERALEAERGFERDQMKQEMQFRTDLLDRELAAASSIAEREQIQDLYDSISQTITADPQYEALEEELMREYGEGWFPWSQDVPKEDLTAYADALQRETHKLIMKRIRAIMGTGVGISGDVDQITDYTDLVGLE